MISHPINPIRDSSQPGISQPRYQIRGYSQPVISQPIYPNYQFQPCLQNQVDDKKSLKGGENKESK